MFSWDTKLTDNRKKTSEHDSDTSGGVKSKIKRNILLVEYPPNNFIIPEEINTQSGPTNSSSSQSPSTHQASASFSNWISLMRPLSLLWREKYQFTQSEWETIHQKIQKLKPFSVRLSWKLIYSPFVAFILQNVRLLVGILVTFEIQ